MAAYVTNEPLLRCLSARSLYNFHHSFLISSAGDDEPIFWAPEGAAGHEPALGGGEAKAARGGARALEGGEQGARAEDVPDVHDCELLFPTATPAPLLPVSPCF